MTDTKLDPATLSATVREMFPPPLVGWLGFYYDSSKDAPEGAGWYCSGKVHPDREEAICDLAGFRPFEGSALVEVGQVSALFGTATEKAVCPHCGEITGRSHSRYQGPGPDKWTCQPAQPEPAAPVTGHTPIGEYDPDMKPAAPVTVGYQPIDRGEIKSPPQGGTGTVRPAAPEMPEAVYIAANTLRASGHVTLADALLKEAWHSQPVAHPFKAGFKPDSMRHFAEYVRDNWHYFGTDTAGLAHQFLQEMAAQPVAVGMTEELEHILSIAERDLRYKEECFEDSARTEPDERIERLRDAIAAVLQQATQVAKVELGTARKMLEYMRRCAWADATYEQIDAALSELDAAEGRK